MGIKKLCTKAGKAINKLFKRRRASAGPAYIELQLISSTVTALPLIVAAPPQPQSPTCPPVNPISTTNATESQPKADQSCKEAINALCQRLDEAIAAIEEMQAMHPLAKSLGAGFFAQYSLAEAILEQCNMYESVLHEEARAQHLAKAAREAKAQAFNDEAKRLNRIYDTIAAASYVIIDDPLPADEVKANAYFNRLEKQRSDAVKLNARNALRREVIAQLEDIAVDHRSHQKRCCIWGRIKRSFIAVH